MAGDDERDGLEVATTADETTEMGVKDDGTVAATSRTDASGVGQFLRKHGDVAKSLASLPLLLPPPPPPLLLLLLSVGGGVTDVARSEWLVARK